MKNILIVEDEGLIALDLKRQLENLGYKVPMIADNCDDALLGIEMHQPDLILMDIRLRGSQDGVATADRIRRRFNLPVIFVTAHADRETLARARVTEPFGYIVKPFHNVDFRAQIEMVLWKHKMEVKLRVNEAWLSTTLESIPVPLIATDAEGNIALINGLAAELTGWSCSEAKGKPLLDVLDVYDESTDLPLVHPLVDIYNERHIASEPRWLWLRRRGSIDLLVEAKVSANEHDGTLLGVIIVFRNTSARREFENPTVDRKSTTLLHASA